MAGEVTQLTVRVVDDDADAQELERLTAVLRTELLELDVLAAEPETGEAPPDARAVLSFALGGLVISFAGMELLGALVGVVTAWLQRDQSRSVKLGIEGDVLELTGVATGEQRRLTDEWLRRRRGSAPKVSSGSRTELGGTRMALIVASDEYADPGLRRLRAPAQDAQALAGVLGDPRIGGFDVRTMLNEPTQDVNEAVEEFFADRDPDDLLLLHFSGHGVKDANGELYFATPSTKLNRLGATAVSAEFVNRRMSRSRSRRVVLLLDCCYAGAFARGALPRAGLGVNVEEQFGGRGRVVITASNAMEYAFDGAELADIQELSPSVFTSALVSGLETGEADRDSDGYVAIDELYDHVYDTVRRTTPSQTPGKWTFDVQGELYIARRARPVRTPVALPEELQHAVDHPIAKIRAGAVGELERLRHSRHEGLALAARLALEGLAGDDSRLVSGAAAKALDVAKAVEGAEPVAGPATATPLTASPSSADPEPADSVSVDPATAAASPSGAASAVEARAGDRSSAAAVSGAAAVTPSVANVPKAPAPVRPVRDRARGRTPTPEVAQPAPEAEAVQPAPASPPPAPASPPTDARTAPMAAVAEPVRRLMPVRVLSLAAALLLLATPQLAALTPIASIWLALLVTATVLVALLPAGRQERDVAVGATFGLAAMYLGYVVLLGMLAGQSWQADSAPALVGGLLALAVVGFEWTSAAPGRWRLLDGFLAVLVLGTIVAHLDGPNQITEGPGETGIWIATVILAGVLLAVTVLQVVRNARRGSARRLLVLALGLATTLLVSYDLVEVYHQSTGRNPVAAGVQPAFLVILLVAAGSASPRPYFLLAARLSVIVGSLSGVAYYQALSGPLFLVMAPYQPARLVILLLAAGCAMAAAYLSRPPAVGGGVQEAVGSANPRP